MTDHPMRVPIDLDCHDIQDPPMTPTPIAARLRQLAEAVRPGPWRCEDDGYIRDSGRFYITDGKVNLGDNMSEAVATFLSACRDGVPALLVEIDALQARCAELEAMLAPAKKGMQLADEVMAYCNGDAWERECTCVDRTEFARLYAIVFPPELPAPPKLSAKQRRELRKKEARAALAPAGGEGAKP